LHITATPEDAARWVDRGAARRAGDAAMKSYLNSENCPEYASAPPAGRVI